MLIIIMVEMMRIGHGIDDACTVAAAVVSEIAVVDNADGEDVDFF